MAAETPDDPVQVVRRWEASGGTWRVLAKRGDEVTLGLFTCDGAEEMLRLTSGDASLRTFLAGCSRDASCDEGR